MRVGLVQLDMLWCKKKENMEKCEEYFIKAQSKAAELLVFPEMTLTGFSVNTEAISELVTGSGREKHSPTIDFFRRMNLKYKIAVLFGFSEKGREKLKNKMILLDRGEIIYEYQKIHPFTFGAEGRFYVGGDEVSTAKLSGHIISGFICYDLRFPAVFQAVSKQAEVIFVIANWPKAREQQWLALLKARAIENQCYIVGVNRIGDGGGIIYSGKSTVIDAAGEEILPPMETEGIAVADLDFDWQARYKKSFPTYLDRRDNLYYKLHILSDNDII